jgi:Ca2+-binding RTX toxin-like protein
MRLGRPLAAIVVVLLALPAFGLGAESVDVRQGGPLVIQGDDTGDHVYIGTSGSEYVIQGYMPGPTPQGCTTEQPHKVVHCDGTGVTSVEVDMGGSSDKLEVVDPLPVPLAVHLGAGSDKLIGNDEPDTCYQDATNRNRCIGNGGDDVCIGGPRRGDCLGGSGNDTCVAMADNDGCWGGSGDDTCKMGPGSDECYGDAGNDTCIAGGGNDLCEGGGGNDRLIGGGGTDGVHGGPGRDYCDGGPGPENARSCESGPSR